MITVAVPFWQANRHSKSFSSMYDEGWVERLYRSFARHLTVPFNFVVFTERVREYSVPVAQELLTNPVPGYEACLEPFRLGEPSIIVGLDTVVTGNIDHLAEYCLTADKIALPKAVYKPNTVCNGVALVPAGHEWIWHDFDGEGGDQADMVWLRKQDYAVIDDLFPGQVVSYKGHVARHGLGDARIVFFHGQQKPHQLKHEWIAENWA
jgi:hypothetical protein